MLHLKKIISSGRFRDVYVHPDDEHKLVKVAPMNAEGDSVSTRSYAQRIRRALKAKLLTDYGLNSHQREMRGVELLRQKKLGDHPYFTRYHGEVMTDKGVGLVVERLTDFYFDEMKTVLDFLECKRAIDNEPLRIALQDFFDFLLANQIYCAGGGPENIAIIRNEAGELAVKSFDIKIFTNKQFWSLGSRKRQIKRRVERQRKLILEMSWEGDVTPVDFVKRPLSTGD